MSYRPSQPPPASSKTWMESFLENRRGIVLHFHAIIPLGNSAYLVHLPRVLLADYNPKAPCFLWIKDTPSVLGRWPTTGLRYSSKKHRGGWFILCTGALMQSLSTLWNELVSGAARKMQDRLSCRASSYFVIDASSITRWYFLYHNQRCLSQFGHRLFSFPVFLGV